MPPCAGPSSSPGHRGVWKDFGRLLGSLAKTLIAPVCFVALAMIVLVFCLAWIAVVLPLVLAEGLADLRRRWQDCTISTPEEKRERGAGDRPRVVGRSRLLSGLTVSAAWPPLEYSGGQVIRFGLSDPFHDRSSRKNHEIGSGFD